MQIIICEISLSQQRAWNFPPHPPAQIKNTGQQHFIVRFLFGIPKRPGKPALLCTRVCVACTLEERWTLFSPLASARLHSGMMQPTDISSKKTTLGAFYCTADEVVRGNWDLSHFQHVKCKSFFSVKSVAFRLGSSQTSRLPPDPQ